MKHILIMGLFCAAIECGCCSSLLFQQDIGFAYLCVGSLFMFCGEWMAKHEELKEKEIQQREQQQEQYLEQQQELHRTWIRAEISTAREQTADLMRFYSYLNLPHRYPVHFPWEQTPHKVNWQREGF